MRLWLALIVAALTFGCATLPEVHPWRAEAEAKTPTLVGARGTLSKARVEAIMKRVAAKSGGSDLLTRHLAIEEEAAGGTPLALGNSATLLRDGPAFYRAMFDAIESARDHVNVEFYIVEDGEIGKRFSDALIRKASQGVPVNFMYDSVGSIETSLEFFQRLRDGGVNVLEFNPVNPLRARGAWRVNSRNHRKLVVVDGRVAFTGGINISNVYARGSTGRGTRGGSSGFSGSGSGGAAGSGAGSVSSGVRSVGWRDTNVRIEGPAVAQMQRLFLDMWASQGGKPLAERNWFPEAQRVGDHPVRILASGPSHPAPSIYVSLLSAIGFAAKSVHITMAYFVPDPQTIDALKAAAQRGVDVALVLPSYTDFWAVFHAGRSHYSDLLAAGVKIYERGTALLHAKTIVIDGVWSTVGSANLDWRSFLHNEELNAVILGADFGKQMQAMFEEDLRASQRVEPDAWERRPVAVRMREWAARVWEYWL
jgi:cardiolipin synthase